MDDLTFTKSEKLSPTWGKLRKILSQRIADNHMRNASDLPPDETAKVRGRISELTHLLALGDDQLPPHSDTAHDASYLP